MAGLTPVPSVLFYWSYSQVPIGVTWSLQLTDDFSTSSVGAVCGELRVISHIAISKTKLYGSNTINGHYQPRDWEPAERIGEAVTNPCRNG